MGVRHKRNGECRVPVRTEKAILGSLTMGQGLSVVIGRTCTASHCHRISQEPEINGSRIDICPSIGCMEYITYRSDYGTT